VILCLQLHTKNRDGDGDEDGDREGVLAQMPTCSRSLSSVEGTHGGSRTFNSSVFCKAESITIYIMLEISYSQHRFNHAIIRLLSLITQQVLSLLSPNYFSKF